MLSIDLDSQRREGKFLGKYSDRRRTRIAYTRSFENKVREESFDSTQPLLLETYDVFHRLLYFRERGQIPGQIHGGRGYKWEIIKKYIDKDRIYLFPEFSAVTYDINCKKIAA